MHTFANLYLLVPRTLLQLNLHFLSSDTQIDMGEYIRSAEWDILESEGIRLERNYPCCGDDPYPELIYTIRVQC